jgi:D-alanyl-D-alanine carboxypeptidase
MREQAVDVQDAADLLVTAGAPGAAARVDDGSEVRQAASGVADLRTGRSMQPDLHFRAGSITKSFVAAVVLQLVSEGVCSLEDTVERWLPGLLPEGDGVTIRRLLNHTAGVPQYTDTVWHELSADPRARFRSWSPRELVALVSDRPLDFPPGTSWSYSNTGYIVLGLIVEAATGAPLDRELARRIFGPLELHHTSFPVGMRELPSPASRGYSPPLGPELQVVDGALEDFTDQDPSFTWAAGAAVSELGDLTRFFRALLTGRVVPPGLVSELLDTVEVPPSSVPLPALLRRYGLGIVEIDTPSGPLVGHPGGIPGFLSMVLSTRDGGRQLGVMTNVGDRAPEPVIDAFVRAFTELGARLYRPVAAGGALRARSRARPAPIPGSE